jgi:hypothetical protein
VTNFQDLLEDDGDDTHLFERLQVHTLENYPNPERIGCPPHAVLEAFVASPALVSPEQLNGLHILRCAECTRALIELRFLRESQRPTKH